MAGLAIVAGSMAQRPGHGGHAWVFLQYLLGFRHLGWEVLFIDSLNPEMCVDGDGRRSSIEESYNWNYFHQVMADYELLDSFVLLDGEGVFAGLSRSELLERVRESDLLLNVMGYLEDEEILSCARRRVFLDIDPGFSQMWQELGLAHLLRGHDNYVTIGLNIGDSSCAIPDCGIEWIRTPQPVVLEFWPVSENGSSAVTSVVTWRGPFGPLDFGGKRYGLRVHEFRKFARLPEVTGEHFTLALDIHPAESNDLELLRKNGWQLVSPRKVAGSPQQYQNFIQRSRAELMIAKNIYVETVSGWFSDRSICYLASGKPVLAQDTGFGDEVGDYGLLFFRDMEECLECLRELNADYRRHAAGARSVAEELFNSDRVLRRLTSQLGV